MAANSRLAVAAHIVAVLGSKPGEFVPSAVIASSVNTNPVVIRRILSALARAGLVQSEKGKAGGSKLSRRPEEVSLWDVHRALGEEHLFAIHRNPENPRCSVSCRMKKALAEAFFSAEKAAEERLRRISVSELLRQ